MLTDLYSVNEMSFDVPTGCCECFFMCKNEYLNSTD